MTRRTLSNILWAVFSLCIFFPTNAAAHSGWNGSRADAHAPIGVMGDHFHSAGEWMLSYRFMFMRMAGNRDGTSGISAQAVRDRGYMVVPKSMNMFMHMFGMMFAPTDWVTTMVMIPVLHSSMEHQAGMPLGSVQFATSSVGLGDITLSGLFKVFAANHHRLHINAGAGLPSGSIHVRDDSPMQAHARLPYPMRLGSGAVTLRPGITYVGQVSRFSWGAQAVGVFPLYKNEDGYRDSMEGRFTGWAAVRWMDWVSTSVRLLGLVRSNLDGQDSDLNPSMVPTADSMLRGGRQLFIYAGVNIYAPTGLLAGHRLAVEAGFPLFRSLDGPQLETDWQLTTGWQWAF